MSHSGLTDDLADYIRRLTLRGKTYEDDPNIGAEVLNVVRAAGRNFFRLPSEQAHDAWTLWCTHTWLMPVWHRTPRLLLVSPVPGCGKTTVLEITQRLVPRAPRVISGTSEAAFYQRVEDEMKAHGARPTILHDQLDKLFGNTETRRISNPKVENMIETGFQHGGTVSRKLNGRATDLDVYAAVALAGAMDVGYVPESIRSRSIIIGMQRALPGEVAGRWNERYHAEQIEALGWLLSCWVEFIYPHALTYLPDIPESLTNRDADKWEPLLTMGDLAGGDWPDRGRVASVAGVAGSEAASPSEAEQVLWAMQAIFNEYQLDKIHTEAVMPKLVDRGFRWANRPVSESSLYLATLLRAFGVAPRSVRIGPKSIRGFRREWFEEAWLRYPAPVADPSDEWDAVQPATPTTPTTTEENDDE